VATAPAALVTKKRGQRQKFLVLFGRTSQIYAKFMGGERRSAAVVTDQEDGCQSRYIPAPPPEQVGSASSGSHMLGFADVDFAWLAKFLSLFFFAVCP